MSGHQLCGLEEIELPGAPRRFGIGLGRTAAEAYPTECVGVEADQRAQTGRQRRAQVVPVRVLRGEPVDDRPSRPRRTRGSAKRLRSASCALPIHFSSAGCRLGISTPPVRMVQVEGWAAQTGSVEST